MEMDCAVPTTKGQSIEAVVEEIECLVAATVLFSFIRMQARSSDRGDVYASL